MKELTGGNPFLEHVALLSAVAVYVKRHGGQQYFVLHSPSPAGSGDSWFPVVVDFERLQTFQDVLESMRQQLRAAYQSPSAAIGAGDCASPATLVSTADLHSDPRAAPVGLHVRILEASKEVSCRYSSDLYRSDTVADAVSGMVNILDLGLRAPAVELEKMWESGPADVSAVHEWNDTEIAYERDSTLQALVERTQAQLPDSIALACESRSYSYAELGRASGAIAAQLRANGLRPAGGVAIFAGRTFAAAAAMLGVLRAGGFYLPVDRLYPAKRAAYLLADAEPELVVVERRLHAELPETNCPVLCIEDLLTGDSSSGLPALDCPVAPAYLIYTSGSTGNPKGVLLDQRGRVNNFSDFNRRFQIGPGDCVLGLSSMSFDMSAYDVLGTFMAGGKLALVSEREQAAPSEWLELMQRERVSIWHSVPSLMQSLLDHVESYETVDTVPSSLRLVLLGGDWIPVGMADRIRAFWPKARIVGLGGATEVSMDSTFYAIDHADQNWKSVPYGRAMANQKAYVIGERGRLAPTGSAGELFLGGDGVGWGYHRQPGLTAAKFRPDVYSGGPHTRLYATGDLARFQPDGQLELLGRRDFQVKLHGWRIELGEIEAVLARYPGITRAVALVTAAEQGGPVLSAFVATSGELDLSALRRSLSEHLPYYMIPQQIVPLRELPLSVNGKIDRGRLVSLQPPRAAETPESALAVVVASVFAELLGREWVGPGADFFALGGHSLLALRLVSSLDDIFRVEVPLPAVFEFSTPAGLAAYLEREARARSIDLDQVVELWNSVNRMSAGEIDALSRQELRGGQ
ncbi:amino acid adenylation domain-containing protein [Kribbella yunnanensis]